MYNFKVICKNCGYDKVTITPYNNEGYGEVSIQCELCATEEIIKEE